MNPKGARPLVLEEREPHGKVTLERLARAAKAMNCKLIYAVVPDDRFTDLEAIIDERARDLAQQLVRRTEHSMRLEKQGAADADLGKEVDSLADQLKSKMDSRIWGREANVLARLEVGGQTEKVRQEHRHVLESNPDRARNIVGRREVLD